MATFEPGDLIKVPFPYTDRSTRQRRPAFVAARVENGLLWVVMVTSAENRGWRGDVDVAGHQAAGLPAPSVVRTAKIATIEAVDAERLGKASAEVSQKVIEAVRGRIGS